MKECLSSPPGSAALGASIPHTAHALSVSLPTWRDNVEWAEGNARVVDIMATGYPRFFIQRSIQKLSKTCLRLLNKDSSLAMLFPTARIVKECFFYMRAHASPPEALTTISVHHFELRAMDNTGLDDMKAELHAIIFCPDLWKAAKAFWQHSGMGVSSRYAETILLSLSQKSELVEVDASSNSSLNSIPRALKEKTILKRRISNLISGRGSSCSYSNFDGVNENGRTMVGANGTNSKLPSEEHVYLYPTGMSSIWHAHQMCLTLAPGKKCASFGFSYTDTIKVLQRWGPGCITFFDEPETNLANLEDYLSTSSLAALFCEVPSNPLLQSPDLARVRELAYKHGFLIVVDDTVGTFVNVDVLKYVDVVVTSLSKLFSGSANVMGGSTVINPNSRYFEIMRQHLETTFLDDYYYEDALIMEENSRDFVERVEKTNCNTEIICEYLKTRSLSFAGPSAPNPSPNHAQFAIKDVLYPKWVTRKNYDIYRHRSSDHNFGALFSLTFTSPSASQAFYNALQCAKGPSLGTNFTLSCPYTILAHYNEREWAAGYGVEEGIVRLSVGMEEPTVLLAWMTAAVAAAEKTLVL